MKTWHTSVCQADPDAPVLAAGDPERANMKKCDQMGGIPYHINVVSYMVRAALQYRWGDNDWLFYVAFLQNECAKKIGVSPLLPCDKIVSD